MTDSLDAKVEEAWDLYTEFRWRHPVVIPAEPEVRAENARLRAALEAAIAERATQGMNEAVSVATVCATQWRDNFEAEQKRSAALVEALEVAHKAMEAANGNGIDDDPKVWRQLQDAIDDVVAALAAHKEAK